MKLNAEKVISTIVPLYLLLMVLGEGLRTKLYFILSFLLGITMLYLALKLLLKQKKERPKS